MYKILQATVKFFNKYLDYEITYCTFVFKFEFAL